MNKPVLAGIGRGNAQGITSARPPAPDTLYASTALFSGSDRIWIEHNGERYSLRITRQGKLILTK